MPNEFDVAHERLKKVFEYLKAFHNKRFPPKKDIKQQSWHRWLDTLPEHKSIKKGFSADASETGDDFILRVYRPEKTPAPKPPALIEAWVEHGWESPFQAIEIKSHLDEQTDDGESIAIHFEDDPARVEALNIWREKRDAWKATEIPVHNADKFWRQLHKVHAQLERSPETAELMLGDGIFSFHQNNESIYHPLLLQKVRLEFNPETPSLTIYYGEDPVELYATLLQTMTEENSPNLISKLREEVDNNGELLLSENWNDLLTRLVHHFEDGKFIEQGEPPVASSVPATGRRPVLFIRSTAQVALPVRLKACSKELKMATDLSARPCSASWALMVNLASRHTTWAHLHPHISGFPIKTSCLESLITRSKLKSQKSWRCVVRCWYKGRQAPAKPTPLPI